MKVGVELFHISACLIAAYLSFAFIETSFDITTWDAVSRWLTPVIAFFAYWLSKLFAGQSR